MPLISIGQLIDQSWDLFRARFQAFMSISGWLLLLALFYTIALSLYPSASTLWFSNELTISENAGVFLFALTNYLIGPLVGLWVLIGLVRLGRSVLSGRAINPKAAMAEVTSRFLPTLLVSVMVGLLLVLATIIGFGPSVLLAALGALLKSATLVGLANLLLIIGVFVALILSFKWMVEYILAPYATIIDNTAGKKALFESRRLIRGRFWEVLLRLVIPKLVFILIAIILMAVISYATSIVISAVGGLNLDLRLRLSTMVEWVVPIVIAALVNPLIVMADVLLYRSLKGES